MFFFPLIVIWVLVATISYPLDYCVASLALDIVTSLNWRELQEDCLYSLAYGRYFETPPL
jgi:hypothetical protein